MFMAARCCPASTTARRGSRRKLLTSYAEKLQRPDGPLIHAVDGPHAWGRGNGFALLGLTEALHAFTRELGRSPRVLEIYRNHKGLAAHQSDDGS